MNLSLTPLNEAWTLDMGKKIKKVKTNKFVDAQYQKKLLQDAHQEINRSDIPVGNSISNEHNQLIHVADTSNQEKIDQEVLNISITDRPTLDRLRPYRTSYIPILVKEAVQKYFAPSSPQIVETFTDKYGNKSDDSSIFIYIIIALLIIDIIIRL